MANSGIEELEGMGIEIMDPESFVGERDRAFKERSEKAKEERTDVNADKEAAIDKLDEARASKDGRLSALTRNKSESASASSQVLRSQLEAIYKGYDEGVTAILENHGVHATIQFHLEKDIWQSLQPILRQGIPADWERYEASDSAPEAAPNGNPFDRMVNVTRSFFGMGADQADNVIKVNGGPDSGRPLAEVIDEIHRAVTDESAKMQTAEARAKAAAGPVQSNDDFNSEREAIIRESDAAIKEAEEEIERFEDQLRQINENADQDLACIADSTRDALKDYVSSNPWEFGEPRFATPDKPFIAIGCYSPDLSGYRIVKKMPDVPASYPILIGNGDLLAIGPNLGGMEESMAPGLAMRLLSSHEPGSMCLRLVDPSESGPLANLHGSLSGASGGASDAFVTLDKTLGDALGRGGSGPLAYVVIGGPQGVQQGIPQGATCIMFCDPSLVPFRTREIIIDGGTRYRNAPCTIPILPPEGLKSWISAYASAISVVAAPEPVRDTVPEDQPGQPQESDAAVQPVGCAEAVPFGGGSLIFGCNGGPAGYSLLAEDPVPSICALAEGAASRSEVGGVLMFVLSDGDIPILRQDWQAVGSLIERASAGDVFRFIASISDEADRRSAEYQSAGVSDIASYNESGAGKLPLMIVVLAHVDGLLGNGGQIADGARRMLQSTIRKGSAVGIHFIVSASSMSEWTKVDVNGTMMSALGGKAVCGPLEGVPQGTLRVEYPGSSFMLGIPQVKQPEPAPDGRRTVVSSDTRPIMLKDSYGGWTYADFTAKPKMVDGSYLCAVARGCYFGEISRFYFAPGGTLSCIMADKRMADSVASSLLESIASISDSKTIMISSEVIDGPLGDKVRELGVQVMPAGTTIEAMSAEISGQTFIVLRDCSESLDPDALSCKAGVHIIAVFTKPSGDAISYYDRSSNALIGGRFPLEDVALVQSMQEGIASCGGQDSMAVMSNQKGVTRVRPFFHR